MSTTQITVVGLGRMGANISRRIKSHAQSPVNIAVYDVNPDTVKVLAAEGFTPLAALTELEQFNDAVNPQFVWVMVPAEVTAQTIRAVAEHLAPGSTIIDGGNTFYRDDIANATWLDRKSVV